MARSFKSKTQSEQLATIHRQLNIIMKILGVKDTEGKPAKKLVIDTEHMRETFLRRKSS